ncbi:uncharacterized protein METZ01_LOCUS515091, partial [marine metagenome]
STTHNNNKFNVLKETVVCRLLWKTAIICGQVAFFWPFPSSYNITKLPIPAKCHNIASLPAIIGDMKKCIAMGAGKHECSFVR